MTRTMQLRLMAALAALTCLVVVISAQLVSETPDQTVAVEGAVGWLDEEKPEELSLDIHLVNLKASDDAVIDVAASAGQFAQLCEGAALCPATAKLAKSAATVLNPAEGPYVTLASGTRPFEEGEVALIELVLASGQRVPVDVKIKRRQSGF